MVGLDSLALGMRANLKVLLLMLCACSLCSSTLVFAVIVNHTQKPAAVVVLSVNTVTNVSDVLGDVVPKYYGQSMSAQKVALYKLPEKEKLFFTRGQSENELAKNGV